MKFPLVIRRFWHWQVQQRWVMSRFNPTSIRPGDFYENCNYHPMLCHRNDFGDLVGVSLVDGSLGSCSVFHCAPIKFANLVDAQLAVKDFNLTEGKTDEEDR